MTRTNWVKVSSRPPTYYPRGVAADCPTDHWSGEWVYTNDDKSTRYFIPLHGLGEKRDVLVHEALSARSGRKLAQIAVEDQQARNRFIQYSAVMIPMNLLGLQMNEVEAETFVAEVKEYWREGPTVSLLPPPSRKASSSGQQF